MKRDPSRFAQTPSARTLGGTGWCMAEALGPLFLPWGWIVAWLGGTHVALACLTRRASATRSSPLDPRTLAQVFA